MKKFFAVFCTVSLFVLAGCLSTGGPTPALQQVANDASLVVNGVAAEVQQIQLLYPKALGANGARIANDIGAAQAAVSQLTALTNTPVTGKQLDVIDKNINDVLAIVNTTLAGLPACQVNAACSAITIGLGAAQVLLPGIEQMANQLITGTNVPPAPTASSSGMSQDDARLVLRGAAQARK